MRPPPPEPRKKRPRLLLGFLLCVGVSWFGWPARAQNVSSLGSADAGRPQPATDNRGLTAPMANSDGTNRVSDSQAGAFVELDRRTRELQDQVFRSKAALTLLTENWLGSAQGGARLVVVQKNKMGRLYQLLRVAYQLDGREVFLRSLDTNRPETPKEQTIFDGNVRPGDHTLAVSAVFRGDGNKVFSYFNEYTFSAKAAHRFSVADGQTTRLEVLCREKGNPLLTRVEERPTFDFRVETAKKAN